MSTHKTAVIGLGAMGMGMAQSAHVAGLQTVGMDINPAAMVSLAALGATVIHNMAVSHFAAELKDEASTGIAKVENWFKKVF